MLETLFAPIPPEAYAQQEDCDAQARETAKRTQWLVSAIRELGENTRGYFDVLDLCGPRFVKLRQRMMTLILHGPESKLLPQSQCGVNALRRAFWDRVGCGLGCLHEKQETFAARCRNYIR